MDAIPKWSQYMNILKTWYNYLHYYVIPPIFIIIFTIAVQWIALLGEPICPIDLKQCPRLLGSTFSWTVVIVYVSWVIFWLVVPSKQFFGPESPDGEKPNYQDNGALFYIVTLFSFSIVKFFKPDLTKDLLHTMPEVLASLSLLALTLCTWLAVKAKLNNWGNKTDYNFLYEFYRGSELHPRVLGCDVKQFAVCRMGMMIWQLLLIVAFFESIFSFPDIATFLMQTSYIAKFFWWETGYFTTLDVTYDRAGYYLCWGGIVWIPALFPLSQIYLTYNKSYMNDGTTILITVLSFAATFLEYYIDHQKEIFVNWRSNILKGKGSSYLVWGSPVKYIKATYRNNNGKIIHTALLTSGFWGLARHLNYTCELVCALTWCLPAFITSVTESGLSHIPMLYFYFILGLIMHRIFRDEHKCKIKYTKYWQQYCNEVPYRFIPYLF